MPRFSFVIDVEAEDGLQADTMLRMVLGTSARATSAMSVFGRPDLIDTELLRLLEQEEAIERDLRRAERSEPGSIPGTVVATTCPECRRIVSAVAQGGEMWACEGCGWQWYSSHTPCVGFPFGLDLPPVAEVSPEPEAPPVPAWDDETASPEARAEAWAGAQGDYIAGCACPLCQRVETLLPQAPASETLRRREVRPAPRRPYGVRTSKVRPLP